ncbi:MAG: DUF58 domain-containing protein [Ideonella sp.]|nr:DUF58 domain-containing protein [Ideonella sp.]
MTTAAGLVEPEASPSPDALLRRLEWTVLRRLDGLLQGDYRTLWRGGGLDLADLREYQHGDDVRHIDWNVTARLHIPHVRQYTEDRELSAWFLLDLSGSVDFGSNDRTKLAVSEGFVASVSRLLTRHGNRVGAMFYGQAGPGEASTVLPPRVGRNQVLQLITRMRQRPPRVAGQQTVLGDLLHSAHALIKRRSLVFVVSDFISAPGWAEPLTRLAQRHEVLAVRLYDAAEMTLPDLGLMTLEDAESGEQLLVDTQAPGFLERFEALATAQESELRGTLARAGVDTLELATDEDLMAALLRFVALRRQRLRAPPGQRLPAWLRQAAEPNAPLAAPRAAASA